MLRLLIIGLVLLTSTSVEARHRHHRHAASRHVSLSLTTIKVATGHQITVATHLVKRFQSLIADLAAAGYHPRSIRCFSLTGHVRHSRHHVGAACDFDGSLSRSSFMRSATANRIIAKNHFRNGCSFYSSGVRDCGHVDDGYVHGRRGHR